jgi:photosystem II stability/assembly factor-like uncharacterized protein
MRKIRSRILFSILCALVQSGSAIGQWFVQPFEHTDQLWRVRFVDAANGWILGKQAVYKTTDGGNSWLSQDTTSSTGSVLCTVNRDTILYSSITYGVTSRSHGLRRTSNGGQTWTTVDTAALLWNNIMFVNPQIGFAGGGVLPDYHPFVRKTTDGGASWSTLWIGTGIHEVEGLYFFSESHGWIATWDGALLETTNGGITWLARDTIQVTPFKPVHDLTFASDSAGWVVGGLSGTSLVASTSNGGGVWEVVTFPGSTLEEVQFLDRNNGWFVGMNNGAPYIERTTNGGATWLTQTMDPPVAGALSFSMVNLSLGWAVTVFDGIYKTTNGGATFVTTPPGNMPLQVTLSQNYPNPFNPSTTIHYSLPHSSHVTLTIYTTLGQQVAKLVNEQQQAGYHDAEFRGDGLASGVYFYRLQAGEYSATKKLLLLR